MVTIFELLKDPYKRKTRVFPGLLVVLPILVPLLVIYGAKHPVLTSVMGLLVSCGATSALAGVVRGRGKKLEDILVAKWGGMPTTIALRHRDKFIDSVSKQRYHTAITSKFGIVMPTAEEELANPEQADEIYRGATRRLREFTRSNKQLLWKENIAYGFHRNLLAMKPIGITSCLVGILWGLLLAKILQVAHPHFNPMNFFDPGLAAILTLLISSALLAIWLHFDQDSVKRMGFVYAERLFECLSSAAMQGNLPR